MSEEVSEGIYRGILSSQHRELPSLHLHGTKTFSFPISPSNRDRILDDKALFVNMLLICNFENKIETSCILKYK